MATFIHLYHALILTPFLRVIRKWKAPKKAEAKRNIWHSSVPRGSWQQQVKCILFRDKLNNLLFKKKVHSFATCCETSKNDVLAVVCGMQLCLLVGIDIFVPAGRFFCRYFDEQSSRLFLTFERGKCSISVTVSLLPWMLSVKAMGSHFHGTCSSVHLFHSLAWFVLGGRCTKLFWQNSLGVTFARENAVFQADFSL